MKTNSRQKSIQQFVSDWKNRGYEKGESQIFWLSLLRDVLGVEQPERYIRFEDKVRLDNTSFMDGYIESTHVLIEQKGLGKDLLQPIRQSDGKLLTPFQQAKRYSAELPYSRRPRWVVTCNFRSFLVYDMENPSGEPQEILLENLPEESWRLQFLVDRSDHHIRLETEVSMQAGELVGKLYDALLGQYINPKSQDSLRSLNVLCVRLVFCLYAEDAGVFGHHAMFHDYLSGFSPERMRDALIRLFKVLDTPYSQRDPYMEDALAAFPYVNGGLFADGNIEIPRINAEIAALLLREASDNFDWSRISPTIFGALFESTINPVTRREGGMHYTSIGNIHKVIDPLFLDGLREELSGIKELKTEKIRSQRLNAFRQRLASMKFLDPACGSGNFLTESYLSLRRIENECLRLMQTDGQMVIGGEFSPVLVSIGQFYGMEINDFAVSVARTALWIAEMQMMAETESIVGRDLEYLPLKSYPNIVEGNALRLDWNTVCPSGEMTFVMGNPPFAGARTMTQDQKDELFAVLGKEWKNAGNLDYVCGWYKKATDYMRGTDIKAALVSSNSITQGEQTALLWKPLKERGVQIDFAWRTFRWDSEAAQKAHVHCVIVGFSCPEHTVQGGRRIYTADGQPPVEVPHINGYLLPMEDVFVEGRTTPLCDVPEIGMGNQPIDGGNYLFTEKEMLEFIRIEPSSEPYFRKWYGAQEFINNAPRRCLWLGNCTPAELRRMPHCLKRVEAVREYRLRSPRKSTVMLADRPTHFQTENMPKGNYIVIPETSSEKRSYVPMGFMSPDVLCSNAVRIVPDATLYHFGILTSSIHMAWLRLIGGRLKSDYRYSKDIVYNNFPWPSPAQAAREKIERTAQAVLDARALYPDSSLADLYDDTVMPPELRRAHRDNDRAVSEAYGFPPDLPEEETVARLFALYSILTARR